jgi:transposase
MSSTRRKYTREFKIEAAKLSYNSDKPVEAIAEKLGVSQSSLNRWRREFGTDPDQAFPGNGQRKERDVEVSQLKRELKQAQMENEILKKAVAIPSTLRLCSGQASRGARAEIPVH